MRLVLRGDLAHELAGDPHPRGLLGAGEAAGDLPEPFGGVERAGRDLELGPEVVQMPAQPLLILAASGDEILAMVDQQANVERRAVEVRAGEILDPSLSAARATLNASIESDLPRSRDERRAPAMCFGRDAHDPLAAGDQEPLERAGHVPAVLDRPHPL